MKAFLVVLATISLLLNAYLLVQRIDASSGGGIHKQSADMNHTVKVGSKRNSNPLSPEKRVLHKGFIADERIRTFTVIPISEASEIGYRELEDPIQWSEDSQVATVTTPDFTLSINLKPKSTEQASSGQPATRSESKPEDGDKPQPESEGRSR